MPHYEFRKQGHTPREHLTRRLTPGGPFLPWLHGRAPGSPAGAAGHSADSHTPVEHTGKISPLIQTYFCCLDNHRGQDNDPEKENKSQSAMLPDQKGVSEFTDTASSRNEETRLGALAAAVGRRRR